MREVRRAVVGRSVQHLAIADWTLSTSKGFNRDKKETRATNSVAACKIFRAAQSANNTAILKIF